MTDEKVKDFEGQIRTDPQPSTQGWWVEKQIGFNLQDGSHFAVDFCFYVRSIVEYCLEFKLVYNACTGRPAPTDVSKNFREGRVGTFFTADSAKT